MPFTGQWLTFTHEDTDYPWYVSHDTATTPYAAVPNSFGWLPGPAASCAGIATSSCAKYCYVNRTMAYSKATGVCLAKNWATLMALRERYSGPALEQAYSKLFTQMFRFIVRRIDRANTRLVKQSGKQLARQIPRAIRNLWSGEMFCPEVARAMCRAMLAVPATYWQYTRSPYIDELIPAIKAGRLKLQLSADKENFQQQVMRQHIALGEHGVALSVFRVLDEDEEDTKAQYLALLGDALPAMREAFTFNMPHCPKVDKRTKAQFPLPLKSGDVGPCIKCGICIDLKRKPKALLFVRQH